MSVIYEYWITFRNFITKSFYRYGIKPLLFHQDPEDTHQRMTFFGKCLGSTVLGRMLLRALFNYRNSMLEQNICGIHFRNPLGLAAGFDKDAQLIEVLPCIGFAYEEAGSITGLPCTGNPRPRLWRLPHSQSLIVYYGLKSKGCDVISTELKNKLKNKNGKKSTSPLGISVAKTNCKETVSTTAGVEDYYHALKAFVEKGVGDYYTINISCPNSYGGEPFTDPRRLEKLLKKVRALHITQPIFLKLAADLDKKTLDAIFLLGILYHIQGFICTNLSKDRNNPALASDDRKFVQELNKGGMSGKPVRKASTEMIRYLYKKIQIYQQSNQYRSQHHSQYRHLQEMILIGCGGIFTAEDAYEKITAGASLLQLITGMIYHGPSVLSEINQGLVKLLKKDGFSNISEAVGSRNRVKVS